MTTIIRRKRASRGELTAYRRHELLTGWAVHAVIGYSGYTDGQDTDVSHFIDDEMKRDWLQNRDELLAFWKSGENTTSNIFSDTRPWLFVRGYPGTKPWAATVFDKDDPPEPKRRRRAKPESQPELRPEPQPSV
jgi:hypothetical protein